MADAKETLRDKFLNPLDLIERAKEKIETTLKHHDNGKEIHGLRNDIDENTPLSDVKAPNVFERAKEEIEALVETLNQKIESKTNGERDQSTKPENSDFSAEEVKAPNLIERAKEELEAIVTHYEKSQNHHHRETHGRSDDIDENTPIDDIKAPNVFERAKEEMEAIVETILPKKQSSNTVSSSEEKEKGFWSSIGKWLESLCSPQGSKRD